jgi:hypothetical protein
MKPIHTHKGLWVLGKELGSGTLRLGAELTHARLPIHHNNTTSSILLIVKPSPHTTIINQPIISADSTNKLHHNFCPH